MRSLALVLALSTGCTLHHAIEIGGVAVATGGLVLAAGASRGDGDCSDGFGQCTFGGSIDSAATRVGEGMIVVGLVAAFVALVTDHPPPPATVNQLPK
jgi:hypothetical protein